jgi:dTDP-L-rhamnose 4-epimerase
MYQVAEYADVNVGGTATLLDLLANEPHDVRRLILGSSRAVYGEGAYECALCGPVPVRDRGRAALEAGFWDPLCPRCASPLQPLPTSEAQPTAPASVYALSKLAQEHLVRCVGAAYGLDFVILRYFNVYGPGQSLANPYTGVLSTFFARLRAGRELEIYEDGLESRDFVHVSDAVRASILAFERYEAVGNTINVGSGQPTTLLEIARLITRLSGQPDRFVVSGRYRSGDIRHCHADISSAQRLLGFSSAVALAEGLTDFVAWASREQTRDRSDVAERELAGRGLFH